MRFFLINLILYSTYFIILFIYFLLMEGKTTLLVYLCLVEGIVLHYIILLLLGETTLGHTSKGKSKTRSSFKYIWLQFITNCLSYEFKFKLKIYLFLQRNTNLFERVYGKIYFLIITEYIWEPSFLLIFSLLVSLNAKPLNFVSRTILVSHLVSLLVT